MKEEAVVETPVRWFRRSWNGQWHYWTSVHKVSLLNSTWTACGLSFAAYVLSANGQHLQTGSTVPSDATPRCGACWPQGGQ